jgi:hypothetical protein
MARNRDEGDGNKEDRNSEAGDDRLRSGRPSPQRDMRGDEDYEDQPGIGPDGTQRLSRSHLWSIAFYQKGILLCILVYILTVIAQFFIPEQLRWVMLPLVVLPVCLAATVFVFLLATKVYNPVVGVLLGFLTLIPCIGLLVLLVINSKATSTLKRHGIGVGLLGADLSKLS